MRISGADTLSTMESAATNSERMRGYPCQCCGFLALSDPSSGSYEICPVCFWEDDPVQNEDPFYPDGTNQVSLNEARRNFVELGAAEVRCLAHVRGPYVEEVPSPPMLRGLDSELRDVKERAVNIALLATVRSIKAGGISLLEGCTAISALGWPLNTDGPMEERLRLFNGVAGEVEDMPNGEARKLWSAAALVEQDARWAEYEKRVRSAVMAACEQLETALLAELKS